MKKLTLLSLTVVMSVSISIAQNKPKSYAKLIFNNVEVVDNPSVTISIQSAVANETQTKFKLKVVNKTNDFILIKFAECKFVAGTTEVVPKEKDLLISPIENDFRVVNVMGVFNSSEHCSFVMDGVYKISAKGNSVNAPDFKLPVNQPEFSAGPFNITNTDVYKQTDATKLKFNVVYTGNKTGYIFTTKPMVLMPDNNEYACAKPSGLFAGPALITIKKGTSETFEVNWDRMPSGKTLDMQKVNMHVKWHDTFCELDPAKEKTITIPFDINTKESK